MYYSPYPVVRPSVAGTEEQVALAFLVIAHPLSEATGTSELRKRRGLRPPARAGPGAGGRLSQAAPRTGPLGPGLWQRGPERWPPPAAPLRRTLQARAPTLRTARRVRSQSLAAAHPPTTPAPPPPAAAVRSVNIPASPRRGRGWAGPAPKPG